MYYSKTLFAALACSSFSLNFCPGIDAQFSATPPRTSMDVSDRSQGGAGRVSFGATSAVAFSVDTPAEQRQSVSRECVACQGPTSLRPINDVVPLCFACSDRAARASSDFDRFRSFQAKFEDLLHRIDCEIAYLETIGNSDEIKRFKQLRCLLLFVSYAETHSVADGKFLDDKTETYAKLNIHSCAHLPFGRRRRPATSISYVNPVVDDYLGEIFYDDTQGRFWFQYFEPGLAAVMRSASALELLEMIEKSL